MGDYQSIVDHAEQHCQERGSQLTAKRKLVLSGLLQSERALSAYELVDYCKENFNESLPAMSVYRILDFLESEQLVHKLEIANCYVACEHIACDHRHEVSQFLICTDCRRVKEIAISKSTLTTLRRNVEAAGFVLRSPHLETNCLCESCSLH
jgi:Fur family zinc uptake transcriptional regulator